MQTGALRALAYTGPSRHPAYPDVPTVAEIAPNSGVSPVWLGLLGPKGMPAGLVVSATTPEELGAQIRRNHEQFGRLLTELNIKPE